MGVPGYEDGFKIKILPERLLEPLRKKKPTTYFVNSMSDLFHERVSFEYIEQVFDVIERANQHTFQVLTKRGERMAKFFRSRPTPSNAWLGVSVEDKKYGVPRIDVLREVDARIRFLSIEPLLEDIGEIDLSGIHWVIVGGESGPKARAMKQEWVEQIRRQCQANNVAFFFKQWGGWGADGKKRAKRENGRELMGRTWDEMPLDLAF
jgi:protein gp37